MTANRPVDDLALELLSKRSTALFHTERRVLQIIHKRKTIRMEMRAVHEEDTASGERLAATNTWNPAA